MTWHETDTGTDLTIVGCAKPYNISQANLLANADDKLKSSTYRYFIFTVLADVICTARTTTTIITKRARDKKCIVHKYRLVRPSG